MLSGVKGIAIVRAVCRAVCVGSVSYLCVCSYVVYCVWVE